MASLEVGPSGDEEGQRKGSFTGGHTRYMSRVSKHYFKSHKGDGTFQHPGSGPSTSAVSCDQELTRLVSPESRAVLTPHAAGRLDNTNACRSTIPLSMVSPQCRRPFLWDRAGGLTSLPVPRGCCVIRKWRLKSEGHTAVDWSGIQTQDSPKASGSCPDSGKVTTGASLPRAPRDAGDYGSEKCASSTPAILGLRHRCRKLLVQ
ncbi:uncharacterized protein LOC141567354 [Rhinolophus sinicus]|uniref:uncharacterized protein LOC141567354 n=1 Tax=Rhinolophus sinicus TaxID=89399 RepID=UPI003D7BEE9F